MSWQPHFIKQGDSHGGWIPQNAEYQLLRLNDKTTKPFGLAQMDNREVLLLCSWENGDRETVFTVSQDRGNSWNDFVIIPGAKARPALLAYLGEGNLSCYDSRGRAFSSDYGRTWSETHGVPPAGNGLPWYFEGNPLIDRDSEGVATQIAEVGWHYEAGHSWPDSARGMIRWSNDGGRTWSNEITPSTWRWQEEYQGGTHPRGVSEGSLVRAANGWIIAALRTDLPMRFIHHRYCPDSSVADQNKCYDDSLEGLGVSISKDNGETWSLIHMLYDAGRHHPHLLRLPNDDLVMTVVVRADVPYGSFTLGSRRRGCEAIVSKDNGLTWDLTHKYILDEFGYHNDNIWFDGQCGHLYSTLLDDGSILTCYGNYLKKGACLIRWKPN